MSTVAPAGCRSDLDPRYYKLCDKKAAWGIVLEALAGMGAVASVAFMIALLVLICKVQDSNKRKLLPTQFLFLLGRNKWQNHMANDHSWKWPSFGGKSISAFHKEKGWIYDKESDAI